MRVFTLLEGDERIENQYRKLLLTLTLNLEMLEFLLQ